MFEGTAPDVDAPGAGDGGGAGLKPTGLGKEGIEEK